MRWISWVPYPLKHQRRLADSLRVPINAFGYYQRADGWYRVSRSGWKTLARLSMIYKVYLQSDGASQLLRCRCLIRELESFGSVRTLNFVIQSTRSPRLRILAIWIRGRMGRNVGTLRLAEYSNHPDARVRKEVARAWRRMLASDQLRHMAHREAERADACDRVIRIATLPTRRPFHERLSSVLARVETCDVSQNKRHLFVSPLADPPRGSKPKASRLIGMILMRIRSLVRRSPFAERV